MPEFLSDKIAGIGSFMPRKAGASPVVYGAHVGATPCGCPVMGGELCGVAQDAGKPRTLHVFYGAHVGAIPCGCPVMGGALCGAAQGGGKPRTLHVVYGAT